MMYHIDSNSLSQKRETVNMQRGVVIQSPAVIHDPSSMGQPNVDRIQLSSSAPAVRNVRSLLGGRIVRSACPDHLGIHLRQNQMNVPPRSSWSETAALVLYDITMILDLRMDKEIDQDEQLDLIALAPGGSFEAMRTIEELEKSTSKRQHFRPSEDMGYSSASMTAYAVNKWAKGDLAGRSENDLLIDELNERGLVGLYESILEQKTFSATVLKAITIHLEQNPAGQILVHCTLGKDRTGMVAMLCLSLCGYSDEYICEDFEKSNCIYNKAFAKFEHFFHGRVEASRFAPSRKEVMKGTLAYLRTTYGTVSRYLLEAGFDSMWQDRLRNALSG